MRHTFILDLDDRHTAQLEDLSGHFRLSAEDALRLSVRLTHARMDKPDVLAPEFKRYAQWDDWHEEDDQTPE